MAAKEALDKGYWLKEVLSVGLSVVGGIVMAYIATTIFDPNRDERKRKQNHAVMLAKRLKRKIDLTPMEQLLADSVMNPDEIDVSPDAIFGLDKTYNDILEKAVRPLQLHSIFSTTLWRQTRGLLLYGPPGTGKTMIAKALAKSSGCFFMSISAASIMSKWYGDAQKLVKSIFSLASKLQPCIILIDEVDSILCTRGGRSEHETSLSVKTEFMSCWEGITTKRSNRILVMGTTNRRLSLDPAVLRRFTIQFEIPLPDAIQRKHILKGYLRKHEADAKFENILDDDLLSDNAIVKDNMTALDWIAHHTEYFSGSDLHELCSQAAKLPLTELIQSMNGTNANLLDSEGNVQCRPCDFSDFETALKYIKPVGRECNMDDFNTVPRDGIRDPNSSATSNQNQYQIPNELIDLITRGALIRALESPDVEGHGGESSESSPAAAAAAPPGANHRDTSNANPRNHQNSTTNTNALNSRT